MKTKITTLLMAIAFLATSVAFADGQPKSSENNPVGGLLGPPVEVPRPNQKSINNQVRDFIENLFVLPWEPTRAKQDFILELPDRD